MTTAITPQPISASAFLFGNQDSVDALAHALDEQGVVGSLGAALDSLSRAGRAAVSNQIATVAHGLLGLDLGDLLIGGWFKFADLRAAAKRSVAAPGSSQIVDLVTHSITSTHSPYVEVFVNDTPVATVQFDLSITFTVKGAVATVRDGHLVALRAGACDVAGTLAAEGRQLAQREAHFELPLLVHLGNGIPLLRDRLVQPPAASPQRLSAPARLPPLPPGWNKHPPLPGPAHVHAALADGIPGWQITLITAGTLVLAAVLTIITRRIRAARRRVPAGH